MTTKLRTNIAKDEIIRRAILVDEVEIGAITKKQVEFGTWRSDIDVDMKTAGERIKGRIDFGVVDVRKNTISTFVGSVAARSP